MNEKTEPTILTDLELVHRQLHCVLHLCKAVSALAEGNLKVLPAMALYKDPNMGHYLIKMQGDWTHNFMESVGDILNAVDAVEIEDGAWGTTFIEARERWKNLTEELNSKS